MAKELPYFKFTAQEWQNGDISLESYEVKGLFMDICCFYWVKDCSITLAVLQKRFSSATELIQILIDLNIIKVDEKTDFVCVSFLNEQYDILSNARKNKQNAGRLGGQQKAINAKAMLKQNSSKTLAIRKDNIRKDNIRKDNIRKDNIRKDKNNFLVRTKKDNSIISPKSEFDWATKLMNEHPDTFFQRKTIRNILLKWLQHKKEKKQSYTPTGFSTMLTQIINHTERDVKFTVELINTAIASNYSGFMFKDNSKKANTTTKPNYKPNNRPTVDTDESIYGDGQKYKYDIEI